MIATVLMVLDVIVCIALIASVLMQSCQMRSAEAVVVPSSARVMMLIL